MNKFMAGLKNTDNFTYTENGALTHKSTMSDLYDLFAMGGAYRPRSNEDVIVLFNNALKENEVYALKCLFYLRDARGGQGERRFFRVAMKWLASTYPEIARRNLRHIPEFGRWDDLYLFVDTPLEAEAFAFMRQQLSLDVQCKTPSLLAKWLKSENASSNETRRLAIKTRKHFGITAKQYRKTLSVLRARINVLERLMSEGRWDEIEFDKIPSKAGFKYRNAFARHDIERMREDKAIQSYADFAKDTTTKVNAKVLYPYEVVAEANKMFDNLRWGQKITLDDTNRLMINKYWDNLADYFDGAAFNGLAVVDTSGSMTWSAPNGAKPIDVAIALGLYCAEKAKGPFAGHYVSFSNRPQLIRTEGVDFCDKVRRIYNTNLCMNTDIEATFDMLLKTAIDTRCAQSDLPQNLIVISDMEFDVGSYQCNTDKTTLMEGIRRKWRKAGYEMPNLIFWNVNARNNNIPMKAEGGITFVSGFSPVLFEQIMKGKTGYDLMMDKLNDKRYEVIK